MQMIYITFSLLTLIKIMVGFIILYSFFNFIKFNKNSKYKRININKKIFKK